MTTEFKTMQFTAKFEDIKPLNPLFSTCKIYVMYTGDNRNASSISKEVVEQALDTILNIPIVGEYLEHKDNFGGHGGKIEITDEEIKYIKTTVPYGVIPESANIYWESVEEKNGEVNEYLVIDGAILWTGRYEELNLLLDYKMGQSMEIDQIEGSFNKDKKYEITKFVFSALCILGSSKNSETPDEHIEPCFESASIQAYTLDSFKYKFNSMIQQLKYSLQQDAEINQVEDDNKDFEQEGGQSMTEEVNNVEIEVESTEFSQSEEVISEEIETQEFAETVEVSTEESTQIEETVIAEFALSQEQLENELKSLLYAEKEEDDWGYEYCKYYFVDYYTGEKNIVIVADWDSKLYGFPFSVDNDKVTIDTTIEQRYRIDYNPMDIPAESEIEEEKAENILTNDMVEYKVKVAKAQAEKSTKEEYEAKIVEFEAKIKKFEEDSEEMAKKAMEAEEEMAAKEEELATEKVKNSSLETEITSMKSNQRTKDETLIYESFSSQLTEEEINSVKEKANELSLDEIKTQLFALVGQKTAQFSVIDRKNSKISVFNMDDKPKSSKEYAELIEQYRNK